MSVGSEVLCEIDFNCECAINISIRNEAYVPLIASKISH